MRQMRCDHPELRQIRAQSTSIASHDNAGQFMLVHKGSSTVVGPRAAPAAVELGKEALPTLSR